MITHDIQCIIIICYHYCYTYLFNLIWHLNSTIYQINVWQISWSSFVLSWRSSKDPLSLQPAKVQVDHQVLKWNLWRHLARRIHKKTLPTFEGWLNWETGQPGLMPQPHSNQTIRNLKGEETLDIGSVAKVWSRPRIDKTWRCLRQCRYHFAVCILVSSCVSTSPEFACVRAAVEGIIYCACCVLFL